MFLSLSGSDFGPSAKPYKYGTEWNLSWLSASFTICNHLGCRVHGRAHYLSLSLSGRRLDYVQEKNGC